MAPDPAGGGQAVHRRGAEGQGEGAGQQQQEGRSQHRDLEELPGGCLLDLWKLLADRELDWMEQRGGGSYSTAGLDEGSTQVSMSPGIVMRIGINA